MELTAENNDNINKNKIAIAPTYTNKYNKLIILIPIKYKYKPTLINKAIKYKILYIGFDTIIMDIALIIDNNPIISNNVLLFNVLISIKLYNIFIVFFYLKLIKLNYICN
jgi:hypothetical protein